jgi:hypothetical protein
MTARQFTSRARYTISAPIGIPGTAVGDSSRVARVLELDDPVKPNGKRLLFDPDDRPLDPLLGRPGVRECGPSRTAQQRARPDRVMSS